MDDLKDGLDMIGTAHSSTAELKTTIMIHTWLLVLVALAAAFLVPSQQIHASWDGDYVSVIHHEPFDYQVNQFAKAILIVFGLEHPADTYLRENPHLHKDHPKHYSRLEQFVENHWKSWILSILICVHLSYVVTAFVKLYVVKVGQTLLTLLFAMWIVQLGAILQAISVMFSVYLLTIEYNAWNLVSLFVGFTLFWSEFIGFVSMHRIRSQTAHLAYLASQMTHEKYWDMFDEEEKEVFKDVREESKWNPHAMINFVLQLCTNINCEIERRRIHAKYE